MTTRNHRKQKSIIIPSVYKQPKYRFGQLVKQGRIIGMEYYPPDLKIATQKEEEWSYWILEEETDESTGLNMFAEIEVEPLSLEDLQTLVKDEIDFHQRSIAALKEQLL